MTLDRGGAEGTRERVAAASRLRRVNDRMAEGAASSHAPEAEFFCECGEARCGGRLRLTLAEYSSIRARSPRGLLIVPGHERAPRRRIVAASPRFSLVEPKPGTDEPA